MSQIQIGTVGVFFFLPSSSNDEHIPHSTVHKWVLPVWTVLRKVLMLVERMFKKQKPQPQFCVNALSEPIQTADS